MELLKRRILEDGKCFEGGILKVDSFINHQMDPLLMEAIAKEFAKRFSHERINKIMTIEANGIAPAIMVGYIMKLPVVFAKKKEPKTMINALTTTVHSFTKDREYPISISSDYLTPQDYILCIDDFLANGNAALGMIELIHQAGAHLSGMGFIIEKEFQKGSELLRKKNIHVESLAVICSLDNCEIVIK